MNTQEFKQQLILEQVRTGTCPIQAVKDANRAVSDMDKVPATDSLDPTSEHEEDPQVTESIAAQEEAMTNAANNEAPAASEVAALEEQGKS